MIDNNTQAFFSLLRAGLWEQDIQILPFGTIDYNVVYRLAEEQSVVGLVAAGLEHVKDVRIPQEVALQFVGNALQLEQRNIAMNQFIAELVAKMRDADIYTLLVKGQGVAQCYERPLWRAAGDIDFFLSENNYNKARLLFIPLASKVEEEDMIRSHQGLTLGSWIIELHGSLRCRLWKRIDRVIDEVQREVFYGGAVRSWMNGRTQVFMPRADEDVVFIFSHILQHFFKGGIGLRQVGDWCRLMWTYRDVIDIKLLEKRLRKMGLMSEWKAFGSLAINKLGMPEEAMPFYSSKLKWKYKANKIIDFILETGNFGHNRDKSIYKKHSYVIYKAISLCLNTKDSFRHFFIFPKDAISVWFWRLLEGITAVTKGK